MSDTTIRIKHDVKAELAKLGSAGMSYNDVIVMLLQTYDSSITFDSNK